MTMANDDAEQLMSVGAALEMAVGWQRAGELDAAESVYLQILTQSPQQVDALHFLGLLRFQRGDADGALAALTAAVALAPAHADLRSNHGNVLQALGRLQAAESEYRAALAAQPAHVGAWNNLGVVLRAQGRIAEAVTAYRHALELEASSADDHYNLASLLERCHEWAAALAECEHALALDGGHLGAVRARGHLLSRLGRLDEAVVAYRRWLALEPGHPLAQARLAACGGAPAPERCADAYVQGLFDSYADHFDAHLRERLDYRAPECLADALSLVLGPPRAALDVLDAGCGTGLCGPLLRPWARRLHGVDLSPKMLAHAAAQAVYDQLDAAELGAHLQAASAAWDLIAAADTLCYFGALEAVCAAAAQALRPGGCFGFTVECHEAEAAHRLNVNGRYSHRADYVEAVLRGAGLRPLRLEIVQLRVESGLPVSGLLAIARR